MQEGIQTISASVIVRQIYSAHLAQLQEARDSCRLEVSFSVPMLLLTASIEVAALKLRGWDSLQSQRRLHGPFVDPLDNP